MLLSFRLSTSSRGPRSLGQTPERENAPNERAERLSVLKLTPREAFYSLNSTVDIDDAVNRICAEEVTFYPPGIPILQPGELITADIIDYIKSNKNIGRRLIGAADTSLNTIRILKSLSRRDS